MHHRGTKRIRTSASCDGQRLEPLTLGQRHAQIPPDEAIGTGDQNLHNQSTGTAGRPATKSRMKSSFKSNRFIPSTSKRSVLAEV